MRVSSLIFALLVGFSPLATPFCTLPALAKHGRLLKSPTLMQKKDPSGDDMLDAQIQEALDALRKGMSKEEFAQLQKKKGEEKFQKFREDLDTVRSSLKQEYERKARLRKDEMDSTMDAIGAAMDAKLERLLEDFKRNSSMIKADWEQKYDSATLDSADKPKAGAAPGDFAVARVEQQLARRRQALTGVTAALSKSSTDGLEGVDDLSLKSAVLIGKGRISAAVQVRLQEAGVSVSVLSAAEASKISKEALKEALKDVQGVFVLEDPLNQPGAKQTVTEDLLSKILDSLYEQYRPLAMNGQSLAFVRVFLLSALGSTRKNQFPYNMQNVWGGLGKAEALEQSLVLKSTRYGFSWTIQRIGKLVEPSKDVPGWPAGGGAAEASDFQSWSGAIADGIVLRAGDEGEGETSADAATEAVFQSMLGTWPAAANASLSLVSSSEYPPPLTGTDRARLAVDDSFASSGGFVTWEDEMLRLVGPELARISLPGVEPLKVVSWVRLWAEGFTAGDRRGLTTKVSLSDVSDSNGVRILFQPRDFSGYGDKDSNASSKTGASAGKGQQAPPLRKPSREGGVEILVERDLSVATEDGEYASRIRAVRTGYGDGVTVKVMSEDLIVSTLARDCKGLDEAGVAAAVDES